MASYRISSLDGVEIRQWEDGSAYAGKILNERRSGNGEFIYSPASNAARYEGEYLNDAEEGTGVLVWKDGCKYNGTFADGLFNGPGTLTFPKLKNESAPYKYEGTNFH